MEAIVIIAALLSVGGYAAVKLQPKLKKARRKIRRASPSRSRRPARSGQARQRKPAHHYRQCGKPKCEQRLCQVFREGQQACTRSHQG